ncbi:MAG: hypothetical protein SangKO_084180 [Sandaracinaceae bacterium]
MSRRRILLSTVAVYATLTVIGVGWAAFRGRPQVLLYPEPWIALDAPWRHLASLAGGALVAGITLGLTRLWVRRFRWARRLHVSFREVLGALDRRTVLGVALASGIGEEVFFRGALQPSLGYVLTAILFGVVHVAPRKDLWPWTLWALVMGFVLGGLHAATGSLLGPIVAHVWINYANLGFIVDHDPRAPQPDPSGAPRLVHRRERR